MWSIQLLQRTFRLSCRVNYQRRQQWMRTFSSSPCLLNKSPTYYPTDKIKNMQDFEEFASPEEKKHLEILKAEFMTLCREGVLDMAEPTDEQWLLHMNLESSNARRQHFRRIQKKQYRNIKKEEKKNEQKDQAEVVRTYEADIFFKKLYNFTRKFLIQSRVAQAMILEDPILIDLGFADALTYSEISLVVKQLYDLAGYINASALDPTPTLNVIFCNAKPSVQENKFLGLLQSRFEKNLEEGLDSMPVSLITEKSYLELFPRDDLVYLTPDAHKYYHPSEDGIPIIGAIVDKTTQDKLTHTRAFEDQVKMRKLPIDLTVNKFYGSKRLPITHAVDYVSKLQFTGDPHQAITALAPRNFKVPVEKAKNVKKYTQY